jgi:CO/xanthine dehydrogenase Mo-binding subunit
MKKRGRGIGCIIYPVGATAHSNPSNVILKVNDDGSATLVTGTSDVGQGSNTVLCQIAAEELGVSYMDIKVVSSDTEFAPYDHGAGASRQTYIAGNAVRIAAQKVKKVLFEIAGKDLQADPHRLYAKDGWIVLKDDPQKRISVSKVAKIAYSEANDPLPIAYGAYDPEVTSLDVEMGQGIPFETYVFGTQIAEVEVDEETGVVEVLKVTAVHDCGFPINPMLVEGQIQGGISMGIGYALFEEIIIENGSVMNPNFVDYVLPTAKDMPDVQIGFIESLDPKGPFGAKGIGEPATVPTAPAIINAIYDAAGIRLRELPVTPEKVLQALSRVSKEQG